MRRVVLLNLLVLLLPAAAGAQQFPSVLVDAAWLRARLPDPSLVLLHVPPAYDTTPTTRYLPGSAELRYADLTRERDGRQTEVPDDSTLARVLGDAGIGPASRVVVYSADPITAARAFVTLETAGVTDVALLDGGADAWTEAGGTTVGAPAAPARRTPFPVQRRTVIVDADFVRSRLNDSTVALLDTRTPGEYDGTGTRRGLPSRGHLRGAQLVTWPELVQGGARARFRPREELAALFRSRGAEPGRLAVTYCYIGYRASISYFVARYLGYEARLYDGSYDDWSQREFPLVTGPAPR